MQAEKDSSGGGSSLPSVARQYLVLACATGMALGTGVHAVAPALPLVQQQFGLSDFEVGLVTSAYVLPGVVFAVPLGMWADLVGRRWMFVVSAVVYGLAGLLQSLSGTFELLLLWRLVQGLAFASLMPLTVTIIGDAYSGLAQVRAQGKRHVCMAAGDLLVPLIGAQLAAMAWYLPFSAQGITIVPGLAALWVLRPRQGRDREKRPVLRGYATRALVSIRRAGFPSVLTLAFVRFFARFTLLTYLPLQLVREQGASLGEVGVVMALVGGLGFVSAMVAGRLPSRVPPSAVVLVSLVAVGSAVIAFTALPSMGFAFGAAVVYALGDGFIAVLQSSYAARGAPEAVRAGLVAVNGTARNAGKLLGPLIIGLVAGAAGIDTGLVVVAVVVFAGVAVLPGLRRLDEVLRDSDPAGPTADQRKTTRPTT